MSSDKNVEEIAKLLLEHDLGGEIGKISPERIEPLIADSPTGKKLSRLEVETLSRKYFFQMLIHRGKAWRTLRDAVDAMIEIEVQQKKAQFFGDSVRELIERGTLESINSIQNLDYYKKVYGDEHGDDMFVEELIAHAKYELTAITRQILQDFMAQGRRLME